MEGINTLSNVDEVKEFTGRSPIYPPSMFHQAEKDHLQSHSLMESWNMVESQEGKGKQVLDCMWVYVYKFDKHGRLLKCKARLVVRGDQQRRDVSEDTYAATLAERSHRTRFVLYHTPRALSSSVSAVCPKPPPVSSSALLCNHRQQISRPIPVKCWRRSAVSGIQPWIALRSIIPSHGCTTRGGPLT